MTTMDNYNFSGKRVLLRVDFNIPITGKWGEYDFTRIKLSIPTIFKILSDGGSIILLSHWGHPIGKFEEKRSLKHLLEPLKNLLSGKEIIFCKDPFSDETVKKAMNLKSGQIMLLENIRFFPEEKECNEEFAKKLASLGDCYVNDAFGAAHRNHASTVTIAKYFPYDKMFGYVFEKEISNMDKLLKHTETPFTLLMGGNKITSKIGMIEALLPKIDNLLLGGTLAFPFLAAYGYKTGNIAIEEAHIEIAKKIINLAQKFEVNIQLPVDFVISDVVDEETNVGHCEMSEIPSGWSALDIGIKTIDNYIDIIEKSKTLMWDGPMGMYEYPNFSYGTLKMALCIGRATDLGLYSVIGGGDTIAALNKYSIAHKMSYVSSAGGALLEYIEKQTLPAIEAIKATKDSYSIDDYDFYNKKVLIRVDFNVPLDKDYNVVDDTRIITATTTIRKVLTDGGAVILLTHLGRPKGVYEEKYSIKHIVPYLSKKLGTEVKFSPEIVGENVEKMAKELKAGEIMILENLRFDIRETQNDEGFARQLANLGDVYIMNAFGTAHREHASTYMIAKFFP
jgi:phosphoglycerate kinase